MPGGLSAAYRLLAGLVRTVEAVALEFDRHRGIHLAHLLLSALGAHGDRVVVERLLFGEVIAAVLAAVMIGRQRIPPTKSIILRMAGIAMPRNRSYPSHRPDTLRPWPYRKPNRGLPGKRGGIQAQRNRRYPSGVSTPSAGTSCGSEGRLDSETSQGQHTAISGQPVFRHDSAWSYQPAPRPSRTPCISTANAGAIIRSASPKASGGSTSAFGSSGRWCCLPESAEAIPSAGRNASTEPSALQPISSPEPNLGTSTRHPCANSHSNNGRVSISDPIDTYAATVAPGASNCAGNLRANDSPASRLSSRPVSRRRANARRRNAPLTVLNESSMPSNLMPAP